MYIQKTSIRTYIASRGYDFTKFKKDLMDIGVLKDFKKKVTLGKGTQIETGQLECLQLDLSNPNFSGTLQLVKHIDEELQSAATS